MPVSKTNGRSGRTRKPRSLTMSEVARAAEKTRQLLAVQRVILELQVLAGRIVWLAKTTRNDEPRSWVVADGADHLEALQTLVEVFET